MKLRHSLTDPVTLEDAEYRALDALDWSDGKRAATVANYIWPGHKMKEQGAGGAASRILSDMEEKGLVRWVSTGWVRRPNRRDREGAPRVRGER